MYETMMVGKENYEECEILLWKIYSHKIMYTIYSKSVVSQGLY